MHFFVCKPKPENTVAVEMRLWYDVNIQIYYSNRFANPVIEFVNSFYVLISYIQSSRKLMFGGTSMKFFHLSDLHIGLKLFNRDLLEDQQHILKQITEIAGRKRPDAVVIAGDIYDKAVPRRKPSRCLTRLSRI